MSLKQWNIIHCLLVSTGLIIFHVSRLLWPVLILALLSLILLWTTQWYTISNLKPAGGYGNLVTMLRYLLVIFIVSMSPKWSARFIGLIFIIPVLLDALDGFLAEIRKQISKFGTLFDLETDSLFVALAGLLLYKRNLTGPWILPAVYMRYIFLTIITFLQLINVHEKRTRFGPLVAGIFFFSIIAVFIFPSTLSRIILYLTSAAVIVSFGFSFFGILSRRRLS